jgi:hypothetical protein
MIVCQTLTVLLSGVFLLTASSGPAPAAETVASPTKASERDVARRLDAILTKQLPAPAAALPDRADDETFLRRVSLDLTGKLPAAEEIQAFVKDTTANKRTLLIDRLLDSEAYAVNWGRYWRDVLTYHTPASANYLRWQLFDGWMIDQFRGRRSWGEIATALITANGINDECAPVNFLTAHYGNQVEIAATTARVFLGVQLQCAQCHDAKTESWKREQFHELVAFFGRMRIIQHKDVANRGTPYAIEGRTTGQYQMTDKKDPEHLIDMQPRFLDGQEIAASADDNERRAALARLLVSPKNPWFARAYVNRMWTVFMGWGFYPGLADLGAHAKPQYPEALDLLAAEWTATNYDIRWLFRTLALTQTYQRGLHPRPGTGSAPAACVCPQRLRPEQIFEALVKVLGIDENDKNIPSPAPSSAPAVQRHTGLRNMVYQAFRVDPSLPAEEVQGTIPQALLMMNSALVNTFIAAKGKSYLGDALARGLPNEEIIEGLYQRALARKPKAEEVEICRRYLKKVQDRQEALEDIYWSLINSTEFLTKR